MPENIIKDLSSNHNYRTEIPNILFELGLKANELMVYFVIKRTAGDSGNCTKSTAKMAKESCVNRNNFIKIRRKLCEVYPLINKPLVICKERKSKDGDKDTCLMSIVDIWPENYEHFMNLNGVVPRQVQPSTNEVQPPKKNLSREVVPRQVQGGVNEVHKEEQHMLLLNNSNSISKKNAAEINFFLNKIEIPDVDKIRISKKYDSEIIQQAVAFVTKPKYKITTTLQQAIQWACKEMPWIKKVEDPTAELANWIEEINKTLGKLHPELKVFFKNSQITLPCRIDKTTLYYKKIDVSFANIEINRLSLESDVMMIIRLQGNQPYVIHSTEFV